MKARLNEKAPLYHDRNAGSRVVAELAKGSEIELGPITSISGKDWAAATLDAGTKGFLALPLSLIALQDVVLDQDKATLFAKPDRDGPTLGITAREDRLVVLETLAPPAGQSGPGWCLVRHAALGEGYVVGNVKIRAADVPPLSYWRCFLGGGKILAGIACLGGAFLAIRGDWQAGAFLVGVCFLTGGLAGLVYFATTPLREKEFGAHFSWGLVLATYLFSVGVMLHLAGPFGIAEAAIGDLPLLSPTVAGGSVVFCVALGLLLGFQEQRQRNFENGRRWRWSQFVIPLLGGLAIAMILVGFIWLLALEQERPLARDAHEPPQSITLAELLAKGFRDNRYLALNDFRHAETWIVEDSSKVGGFQHLRGWAILVPGKANAKDRNRPAAPKNARVLVSISEIVNEAGPVTPGAHPLRDPVTHAIFERAGMHVMVMNGIAPLPASVRRALLAVSPDTNVDDLVLLASRISPIPQDEWQSRRERWIWIAAAGFALFVVTWIAARRSHPVQVAAQ